MSKSINDESCDIWSATVVFYMLLTALTPFKGNSEEMYRSITNFEQHNFSYYDDIFKALFLMINSKTNPMEDVLKYVVEELVEKKATP